MSVVHGIFYVSYVSLQLINRCWLSGTLDVVVSLRLLGTYL